MTKVAIKNVNVTSFGGFYHIMDVFSKLGFEKLTESVLGKRGSSGKAFSRGSILGYKQLKQNFPFHFFYGDSVNAVPIQTGVVLIANLLIIVLSRSIKRHCAFSRYHGTTYAYVLRRFYRIHGKPRKNLE